MFDTLERYGYDAAIADSFTPYLTDAMCIPARVVRVDRGECDVVTSDGPARARNADLALCTGDWVTVGNRGGFPTVARLLPRRTAIARSSSSGRTEAQILAANVDTVLVTTALDGDVDLGHIERLLALAWESGAQPVVVLTKADAVSDVSRSIGQVRAIAPGVTVLAVSAAAGDGIDVLLAVLSGTVALVGPSGAGKSTLANTLLGEELLATNAVRGSDGKGRHTTVHRELLPLPSGGTLIDTPGLRGVGLWDAGHGIEMVFGDIEGFAEYCRFGDCGHTDEPGCAVLDAIETGRLEPRRLDSYRKMIRENEWVAARSDARLRAERARSIKIQSKQLRRQYRDR